MDIAVASWSLRDSFKDGKTDYLKFPEMVAREFGLKHIELNNVFMRSTERGYLEELAAAAKSAGTRVVNIAVDRTGDLSAGSESERAEALKKASAYFEVARIVGAPRFRVNSGGGKAPGEAELANCIAAYRKLAEQGAREKIVVLMENHGGISGNPAWIRKVMETVNSKFCRTCPDFGNFPEEIRYQGLEAAAKFADIAHAKTYDFDAAGNETKIDVPRCVKILADAGFKGAWSIEYEGPGDQFEGVKKTVALLRRCG